MPQLNPLPEHWIRERILTDEAAHDWVGERVRPLFVPQGSPLPALVYERTGTQYEHDAQGPTRYTTANFRLTAIADDYDVAKQVLATVLPLFRAIREKRSPNHVEPHFVSACFVTDEADAMQEPDTADEVPVFLPYLELAITYRT